MRVAYLLGAGASQACVKFQKSAHGILTQDIAQDVATAIGGWLSGVPKRDPVLENIVNSIEKYDIEQLISLLDESGSPLHRKLAAKLCEVFEEALQDRLDRIQKEITDPAFLYAALIDMHNLAEANEELAGFLTLNYDLLLEEAIRDVLGSGLDYGLIIKGFPDADPRLPVLKLHGSFGWADDFPVREDVTGTLWIPPGFHKRKERYPFNLIWGKAREILDCDILRIIGCQVGMNDWDLLSLLFATRHANTGRGLYSVEVIDWPKQAERVRVSFPYLEAKSLLEIDFVGEQFISEILGGPPRRFSTLDEGEKENAVKLAEGKIRNPFFDWLRQKAERMYLDLGSISTKHGIFARLLTI